MKIDKSKINVNWCNGSTNLDDVAYFLYVKYCDKLCIKEGYELTLVDQSTFITLNQMNINSMDEWKDFYDQAKMILRNEIIEKIKDDTKNKSLEQR